MSRIRSIKPDFWSSEQVMALPRDVRLLFIGLWNFCDDSGRFRWSAKTVKAQVFPGDCDVTDIDVERWLSLIAHGGLTERYVNAQGEHFGVVTGWKHQKINRPQPPKFPNPEDCSPFTEHSLNEHGTITDGSEGIGSDRKGREGSSDAPASTREHRAQPTPKRTGKTSALVALETALRDEAKRRGDTAPALSRSLAQKAAQRVTDHAQANGGGLETAARLLAASWSVLGQGNAWKLCDVPFKVSNASRAPSAKPTRAASTTHEDFANCPSESDQYEEQLRRRAEHKPQSDERGPF